MAVGFPTKANWAAGDVLTAAQMDDLAGTVNTLAYVPPRNPVLNSNASVWQRGTSVAFAGSAAGAYTADRWYIGGTNANQALTISRQATGDTTNLPNIQYAVRCQKNSGQTGNGALSIGQSFETLNSVQFAGKSVTFSFYARAGANYSPTSSALLFKVVTGTGTDQNVQVTGYTGGADTISQTVTLTTTWQRFTATATIPAGTTEIAVNFNWTTTGTASTNDYFEFTGVQLELGSTASTYYPNGNTYQAELAACQRYYQRIIVQDSAGRMSTASPSNNTTNVYIIVQHSVPFRGQPTAIDYSSVQIADGVNAAITPSSLALSNAGIYYSVINTAATGLTQYRNYFLIANGTSAYLGFTAEL